MRKKLIALIVLALVILHSQAAFAGEPNPHVTIINPVHEDTLYSDNLLVSVKLTQPTTIEVSVLQVWKVVNGVNTEMTLEEFQRSRTPESRLDTATTRFVRMDPFTSANQLSFFTRKVENITPGGVYIINVNTLNPEGRVTNTDTSVVLMKAKEENPAEPVASDTPQPSGPSQFLRNLLKTIFGS